MKALQLPICLSLLAAGGLLLSPPLFAQEIPGEEAAKFLRAIEKEKSYPEEDVLLLKRTWDPNRLEDPIQEALRILDGDYRVAVEAFERGEDEAALAAAQEIIEEDPNPFVTAYARILVARVQLAGEEVEPALEELEDLWIGSRDRITADQEVKFLIAYACSRVYERDEAIRAFREYLKEFPTAPERYRTLALQVLRDLLLAGENPLLDVAGRMGEIKLLLKKEQTDEPTQSKQDEVVTILSELIALMEEMEKQGGGGGGGGGGGRGGRGGPPGGNRNSTSPAQNSALPGGAARVGPLRRVSRGKPGEAWGDLKGKDRQEVLQALKGKFPSRYRDLLEQYYKALSE